MCRCWPILAPVTLEQIGSDLFKLKDLCSGAGTLARSSGGELQHALAWDGLSGSFFRVSIWLNLNPRAKTQEMRHWHESEEYQLEMTQGQLDFDEKNMSPEPGKSE